MRFMDLTAGTEFVFRNQLVTAVSDSRINYRGTKNEYWSVLAKKENGNHIRISERNGERNVDRNIHE